MSLLEHQIAPTGDWKGWLITGGRGSGLTYASIDYAHEFICGHPRARVVVASADAGDCVAICAEGESGLLTRFGGDYKYIRAERRAYHTGNGAQVYFHDISRASEQRGIDLLVVDNLKYCSPYHFEHAYEIASRAVVNSVPMTEDEIKALGYDLVRVFSQQKGVVHTQAATYFNPYLSKQLLRRLAREYVGKPEGLMLFAGEMKEQE